MAMDRYNWLPTECADERYPMQLISGEFSCGDGSFTSIPSGKIVNNGWGEIGSRRLVGDPLKGVPERVTAAWFSYTEDQCFFGDVALPHDELVQLFRAGFHEPLTGKRVSWSKLILGMGLGGHVSVWVAGSGLVREVVRGQVPAAELDWSLVLDNPDIERSEFVRAKLESRLSDAAWRAYSEHGPPVSTWPRYAQRHRWRIAVEGTQVPLHMFMRSFNGERAFYDFARQPPGELEHAPKHLQITWLTRRQSKLLTDIHLDEHEVFAAFDQLARVDGPPALLRVEYGTRNRVTVVLEGAGHKLALARSKVEVSSLAG
jgi:hypothetical protein